jgi:hypothetical protein
VLGNALRQRINPEAGVENFKYREEADAVKRINTDR